MDLKLYLEAIANREAPTDNPDQWGFNAYEASGGNYDDAFSLGQDEGEIQLARALVQRMLNSGYLNGQQENKE